MGPQQRVVIEIEGVPGVPRRVSLRRVQRVEVVLDGVDLTPVEDLVAHSDEDVLDPPPELGDQVVRAAGDLDAGQGRVEGRILHRPGELGVPLRDRLLDALAEGVQGHSGLPVAHFAQRELERALPAEGLHARLVQLVGRGRSRDRGQRLAFERLDVHGGDCTRFVHGSSSRVVERETPRPEMWRNARASATPRSRAGAA